MNTPPCVRRSAWFASSLRRTLVLGAALAISVPALLLGYFQIVKPFKSKVEAQIRAPAKQYAESLSNGLAVVLWNMDSATVNEQVDAVMNDPDVVSVTVANERNEVLVSRQRPTPSQAQPLREERDIYFQGKRFGHLVVALSPDRVERELWGEVVTFLVALAAQVFFSLIFIWLLFEKRMVQPLMALHIGVQGLARGELATPLQWDRQDEMGLLTQGIDRMRMDWAQLLAERAAQARTLLAGEQRFRRIVETAEEGIWTFDAAFLTDFVNPKLALMLGYTPEEMLGRPLHDFVPTSGRAIAGAFLKNHQQGMTEQQEFLLLRKDGTPLWTLLATSAIADTGGNYFGALAMVTDISARKQAAEVQQQLADRLTLATHAGNVGIWDLDLGHRQLIWDSTMYAIYGVTSEQFDGSVDAWQKIVHESDRARVMEEGRRAAVPDGQLNSEFRVVWPDGTVRHLRTMANVQKTDQGIANRVVGVTWDITSLKEHQNQLEHMAHFDTLTHLPNRALFSDRLQLSMAQARRSGLPLAVAYLDLDGFKAINDCHGHAVGDRVLVALASRMKLALREGDTLARIGGDEFVAVFIDLENVAASTPMLNRLLAAAAESMRLEALEFKVSASIGVAFYSQAVDMDADQLLRQADQAMYQAKVAGKNRYHVFDAAQDSSLRSHHESLEHIRQAIEHQEFVLHYQPKVNMRTGAVMGVEALIRWQHPEKGLLAPALFLPIIEDHALAVAVGEWVLESALTQIEQWREVGLDMQVSVNVGARQLQQADFVERLRAILAKHPQVHPSRLELEILETSALADMTQVSKVIDDCAAMGVVFALDDFGTGYSSLTYLKGLGVAVLKIDQSFVRDMLTDPDDLAILKGVIGLAKAFNRKVIAEGVETLEHGAVLLQLGCEIGQGYGIARPMPARALPQWVLHWQPDAAWTQKQEVSKS